MKLALTAIGLVSLTAYAGTLIGNGRWVDTSTNVAWKLTTSWTGYHQGNQITLKKAGLSTSKYGPTVRLEKFDLEEKDTFEHFVRTRFFHGAFSPYSVGILNGFRSESLEPAGDLLNPRKVSRYLFLNPCHEEQVFEVSVEHFGNENVHPEEYLGSLECSGPAVLR